MIIHSAGSTATIQLNPSNETPPIINIKSETLDQICAQARLSLNQTKTLTGGITSTLGKNLFPNLSRACIITVKSVR